MNNVRALPGVRVPSSGPNPSLVSLLTDLLQRAESGELQSFIGTGFCAEGGRLAIWGDTHDNVYEMLGSLAWLHAEYIHRHTEAEE